MRDNKTNERIERTRGDERRWKRTTVSICLPILTLALTSAVGCGVLDRSKYGDVRTDRGRLEYVADDEDAVKDWETAANSKSDANLDDVASKAPVLRETRGAAADEEENPSLSQRFKSMFHFPGTSTKKEKDELVASRYYAQGNEMETTRSGSVNEGLGASSERGSYVVSSDATRETPKTESFWSKLSPFKKSQPADQEIAAPLASETRSDAPERASTKVRESERDATRERSSDRKSISLKFPSPRKMGRNGRAAARELSYDQLRFLPPFDLVKQYYEPSGSVVSDESNGAMLSSSPVSEDVGRPNASRDSRQNGLSELKAPSEFKRADPDAILDATKDRFGRTVPVTKKALTPTEADLSAVDAVQPTDENKLIASLIAQTGSVNGQKIRSVNGVAPREGDFTSQLGRGSFSWFDPPVAESVKNETVAVEESLVDDLASSVRRDASQEDAVIGELEIAQKGASSNADSISLEQSSDVSDTIVVDPENPDSSLDALLDGINSEAESNAAVPVDDALTALSSDSILDGEQALNTEQADDSLSVIGFPNDVPTTLDNGTVPLEDEAVAQSGTNRSEAFSNNLDSVDSSSSDLALGANTLLDADSEAAELADAFPFDSSVAETSIANEAIEENAAAPTALAVTQDAARPVVEALEDDAALYEQAREVNRAVPAPDSVDARKASDAATPLTQEEIAWIEQIKGAIRQLLKERESLLARGEDARVCEARLRLLYLAIGEYERSIQEIQNENDPLKVFWESECRGLETLLRNQLEEIDPTFVAERLLSGYESFAGLCPARIRRALWVVAPACYGLYERRDEPYHPGDDACAYCELDYIINAETDEGYAIDVECRWRWIDQDGNELTPFETQRCHNESETKLRDVVLNLSAPIPETFKSGSYQFEIEVIDLNAAERATATQRLTVAVVE